MVCAHALRVQDRKVADAYVKKAEKAILRHFEVQSLPMLQALFLWVLFESWTSRWVWHSYSHRCINLVQSLQLLVDPDDLGGSMAFTAEEANERRMIAWCIYAYLKFFLVTLPLPHFGQKMILSSAKLKFGKAASFWPLHSVNRASIEAVNPKLARHETSNSGSCICLVAEVLDIIMRIKHTHKTPPATAHDIIVNPFHTHAKMDLARILMHPSASQRILTNPATLQEDLTAQFLSEPLKTATFPLTILLTAYHNASTCLLERSRVQLSSHLSLTSSLLVHGTRHASQTQSGAENIASLLSSLHAAYTAARCVAGTCVWLTSGNGVYEDLGGQRDMREQMMVEHWHIAFAFVEAAMTLWLLTCRTRKYWWATAQEDEGVLRMTLEERREIRREVVVISKWIRETQMMWNKVMGPIADCVWEMALEMEQVEDGMKETGFEVDAAALYGRVNPDAELAGVLEGFRTLRVRDDPINSPVMTEPWAFSPLMGELIGGTLTFDSENEGAWRAFYTSVENEK
ncbi:hypothetical protein BC830DRAFT_933973 [Chytriomyces sp. MP71]|nr:hypothetical protein BC830DRAFT_933973 [Chytriomyces sp. MP71]